MRQEHNMSQVCQVPSFAESLIIDLLHTVDPDITWETEYCWAFKLIEGLSSLGEKAVDDQPATTKAVALQLFWWQNRNEDAVYSVCLGSRSNGDYLCPQGPPFLWRKTHFTLDGWSWRLTAALEAAEVINHMYYYIVHCVQSSSSDRS